MYLNLSEAEDVDDACGVGQDVVDVVYLALISCCLCSAYFLQLKRRRLTSSVVPGQCGQYGVAAFLSCKCDY